MDILTLNSLTLDNFKGAHHFVLMLHGKNASIYGDNAAGKSTLYDALTWLLFGKDSRGQSNFDVKPLDADGNVADHGAMTCVEATLQKNQVNVTLKKTYFEKWTTRRGNAEAVFDGHSSEFFVDDVPVKKNEFERRVSALIPEDVFRMLTSVDGFCTMKWQTRRQALFALCNLPSDSTIMGMNSQFEPLAQDMSTLSFDDYKAKLMAKRKGLNATQSSLPARLDECAKTISDLSTLDFDALEAQREEATCALVLTRERLSQARTVPIADSMRNELDRLHNARTTLALENRMHRASQISTELDASANLEAELSHAKQDLERYQRALWAEQELLARTQRDIAQCRERWASANAMVFTPESCAMCGQSLPKETQTAERGKFEHKKAETLAYERQEGQILQGRIFEAQQRMDNATHQVEAATELVAQRTCALAAYCPPILKEAEDLPHFSSQIEMLDMEITRQEQELVRVKSGNASLVAQLCNQEFEQGRMVDELQSQLAKQSMLAYAQGRKTDLMMQAKAATLELDGVDKMLYLCDAFIRFKTRFVEETVNGKFAYVRFKLFKEQVNGGLDECCDVTVNGVPYANLNNGARINAGLDVIATLSRYHGVAVPLFVDNAESVTQLLGVDTQVIRLVVSGEDKKLKVEIT